MSKVTTKINRLKKKLDNISSLEDEFIISRINILTNITDVIINEIDTYIKENPLNGTIFK